jgi:6-phosphogluconate dehydrogenase
VVQVTAALGVPTSALTASLGYFDNYRGARLPANLIETPLAP